MRRLFLLCGFLQFACATKKPVPVSASVDSSSVSASMHQVKRVKVASGVELETLDFGGHGPALVFLPGLGDTGHVYDTLAPEFVAAHHVYAVTRRGFGSSSWPEQGYDTATLGTDIVRVLDGLGIAKASLVGHSMAGPELTWVATQHPDRVEKVIFLDTSFVADLVVELMKTLPPPPRREPDPADLASRASVAALLARSAGGPFPEHEIDETIEFDPKTGRYLRDRVRPDAKERVKESATKVDFGAVRAPVLYLYAGGNPLPERAEDDPGFSKLTPAQQEKMRAILPQMRQREDAAAKMPGWKTVKVEHAKHYLWITNREEVLREMKGFLGMRQGETPKPGALP